MMRCKVLVNPVVRQQKSDLLAYEKLSNAILGLFCVYVLISLFWNISYRITDSLSSSAIDKQLYLPYRKHKYIKTVVRETFSDT